MESLKAVLLLGLFAQQALCQMNPLALMSMMGAGGGGAGMRGMNPMALGMAGGAEMGGSMQEMMLMQALAGSGGSGGSGGASGGGIDPMAMMMMSGGGAAPSSDMMQQMMMLNLMRGQNNGAGSGQGQATSFPASIQNMLSPAGVNPDITPGQLNTLWGYVQYTGNSQRVMDAIQSPTDKAALERDGLPGMNAVMMSAMSQCPRVNQCTFTFCENAEIPYTADTFFMCRGCPRCPMDPQQRNMLNMMNRMGGSGGQNMAQTMMMMRAMGQGGGGGAGGAAGPMNPAMMMALMNMQQQQQQQQQPQTPATQPTQTSLTIPPESQNAPPKSGASPGQKKPNNQSQKKALLGPRPPPGFIAAMRKMSNQMRSQNPGNQQTPA